MTFGHFVVKNAFRNKRRTLLTVLSIAFSLFLMVFLNTIMTQLLNPETADGAALRLAVRRSTSLADQMPLAYMQKLEEVPNVTMVMPLQWFGGIYKDPKNFFANFACDPNKVWDVFSEYKVSPETKAAFIAERTGAVVGGDLARKYGWKVGDRITLLGAIFPVDLEFKLVGLYESEIQNNNFYFSFDYLNESLDKPNTIGTFWLLAKDADSIPGIIETVDAMFRNTPAETKTETEKAFVLGFVSMLGNIQVIIGGIASVVLFTMLLVVTSSMAMTIRERFREVAILKSVGYTRGVILGLILGEAIFVSTLGAVVGCGVAVSMGWLDIQGLTQGFVEKFEVPPLTILATIAIGAAIGAVSGIFPALQASGLKITEAMRRME